MGSPVESTEKRPLEFLVKLIMKMRQSYKSFELWLSTLVIFSALQGILCLQCEVGINNDTQAMECEGSWDKMQEIMKEKLGGKWEEMKNNLTGDMTGLIDEFKKQFDALKDKLADALKGGEERKKRDVATLFRVKRAEEATAEPEPEPEGDDYYCIKKTMGDNTVKSCLPKSVADPLKMACGLIPSAGTVCVCDDMDLCNDGQLIVLSISLICVLQVILVAIQ